MAAARAPSQARGGWLRRRAGRLRRGAALFQLAEIRLRLGRTLEDVRRDAAFLQCLAELDAQETAGRVARHARIVAVHEAAHRLRIFVEQFRQDGEIVVVDDGVDAVADRLELPLHGPGDGADLRPAAYRVALEIDEEQVLLRVKGEPLVERDAEEIVAQ